ncbi:hypothetical protein CPB84DRAFT_1938251 [Gymnopilus junonius]|uniref:Uncharacterized protein n=1 Tax=Gymnopilus junonius TaxID=109634 RepID=A0A9P5NL16_GYMJU|nr:hypothetical protein CPB84DRAFT_1938251 [Gymnopilus junonius]
MDNGFLRHDGSRRQASNPSSGIIWACPKDACQHDTLFWACSGSWLPGMETKHKAGQDPYERQSSISEKVATYMLSLRRRKVQAGETATSARAITPVSIFRDKCVCIKLINMFRQFWRNFITSITILKAGTGLSAPWKVLLLQVSIPGPALAIDSSCKQFTRLPLCVYCV